MAGIPSDSDGETETAVHRVKTALGRALSGVRTRARHVRQYLQRAHRGDGPTSRQSVLRSLGRTSPSTRPAAAGETCDHARTNDAALPWGTVHWYGGWGGHAYWGTDPGIERPPVVFVHGNGGDACNWTATAEHFRERGWQGDELWAISFGSFTPKHAEMSEQLDDFVGHVRAETGADAVTLVGHSLGVTGGRYWLHERNRHDWVDRFVGLGGANDGTCGCPGCEDASDSALAPDDAARACRSVAHQCRSVDGHPLAELDAAADTPGDIDYVMLRGRFDALYWCNRTSPYLDGAENRALSTTHMGLLRQTETIRECVEA